MSTNENTATGKQDVYQKVTDSIVNAIEKGVGTWRMPWHTSGRCAFSPINVASKRPYRGINTLCLWTAAESRGYESGEWGTYKQWQDRGAQVRKGEKSTTVVFWKFANAADERHEHTTGINTNPVGTCARKTRPGLGKRARTQLSGIHLRRMVAVSMKWPRTACPRP